jgi:hypothetical protein
MSAGRAIQIYCMISGNLAYSVKIAMKIIEFDTLLSILRGRRVYIQKFDISR